MIRYYGPKGLRIDINDKTIEFHSGMIVIDENDVVAIEAISYIPSEYIITDNKGNVVNGPKELSLEAILELNKTEKLEYANNILDLEIAKSWKVSKINNYIIAYFEQTQ